MEEKKLTDEEIVKALDICYNDVHCSVDCPYFNLNGRNFCQDKELYKDLKRIVLEHSEQKAEIERQMEEKWQAKTDLENYHIMYQEEVKAKAELQKQVEKLTEELATANKHDLMYWFNAYSECNRDCENYAIENAELQKQVDELNDMCLDCPYKVKFDEIEKQAVKDTAKEILQAIGNIWNAHGKWEFRNCAWFKDLCKRYGVEAE